jgi:hypothetical protein
MVLPRARRRRDQTRPAFILLAAACLLAGCVQGRMQVAPAEEPRSEAPALGALPEEAVSAPAAPGQDVPGGSGGGFEAQVRPLLETRCGPCHFAGGKVYDQLPFDRPETIRTLGERLFTRIQDEEERGLIRAFLASPPQDG